MRSTHRPSCMCMRLQAMRVGPAALLLCCARHVEALKQCPLLSGKHKWHLDSQDGAILTVAVVLGRLRNDLKAAGYQKLQPSGELKAGSR